MNNTEVIDRETYRRIKRMDRESLTKFILRYGDDLLEREGKAIDLPSLKAELSKINGIGSKRLEEIMAVIEQFVSAS